MITEKGRNIFMFSVEQNISTTVLVPQTEVVFHYYLNNFTNVNLAFYSAQRHHKKSLQIYLQIFSVMSCFTPDKIIWYIWGEIWNEIKNDSAPTLWCHFEASHNICPISKNAVSTYLKYSRYIHLMSNFWSIHFHANRLYVHMFDIVDIAFSYGRGFIVC